MVAMTRRRSALDDEDVIFDDDVFDRRYYPRRVYKDGYGPHVSLMLTDAGEARQAAPPRRFDINDARLHRPHPAASTWCGGILSTPLPSIA